MNFFTGFFEKRAKKMYRGENPRYIQKCIKNQKRFEPIIAEWAQRWEEANPTVWGRRPQKRQRRRANPPQWTPSDGAYNRD